MARWLLVAGFVAAVIALWAAPRGEEAHAAGPCGTSHDSLDSEEQQFLTLLQQWRAGGVSTEPMEVSGALNAAAAWFAEWQVTNNAFGSHNDQYGRNWKQRAIDCGYTAKLSDGVTYWAQGSGEGIYGSATGGTTVGPGQALQQMITQAGSQSGIYMTGSPPNFPAKCYGVAVRRSGAKVAWVVVIAQLPASLQCPASTASGGGPPTPPESGTPASSTPSPKPTKTPTPTPTPAIFRSWFSLLSKD